MIDPTLRHRHIIRLILTLQLIAAALLAAGCHDHSHDALTLNRAEALIEEHPDSALSLLRITDSLNLRGRDAAQYNLLNAQAHHKLDLELPSDSAISIAVDYYETEGPDSMTMKSLFYRSCIYNTVGQQDLAIKDITKAWELSQIEGSHYWQAKIAEMTADISEASINMTEAVKWRQIAAEKYEKSGRIENHLYALCDLASTYTENDEPELERRLLDTLHQKLNLHSNLKSIRQYYYFEAFNFYGYFGPFSKADSIYELITSSDMKNELPSSLYISRARILIHENRYDQARHVLDSISNSITLPEDRNILFHTYYVLWKKLHPEFAADSYMDSLLAYQSGLVNTALSQSVIANQRQYYQSEASRKDTIISKSRKWSILIGSGILLLAFAVSMVYLWKLHKKKCEIREKAAIILSDQERIDAQIKQNRQIQESLDLMTATNEALKKLVEAHDRKNIENERSLQLQENLLKKNEREIKRLSEKITRGESMIAASYHQKWETLNLLCRQFYDKTDTDDKVITHNISVELKKFKSDSFYHDLETDLNSNMGNIIDRLRKQCDGLKEYDVRFCILSFAGFTPISIAFLTDSSTANIYVRRQRIKTRIMKANSVDRDEFLRLLNGVTKQI